MSIFKYKKLHMVGVKGVGMAALAEILLKNGFTLSGSDVAEEFMTDKVLTRLGIRIEDFHPRNIEGKDAVIHSNAYTKEHVEIKAAADAGLPIFSYPEVVAELFNAHRGIAVAGSHGKTTTTAMLGHILREARVNMTVLVGSVVADWQSGASAGDLSDPLAPFVLEADEYKEAFLNYRPHGAIITNIDWDHPDYFRTPNDYARAFEKFIALISVNGFLVVNGDDEMLVRAAQRAPCKVMFVSARTLKPFSLGGASGAHMLFDANAAYLAARELGVSAQDARAALENFKGTARRMEFVGQHANISVFDDYAHHPTEIRATLAGLRRRYPRARIVAVFQPHTFSRTKALFEGFAAAFGDADMVVFTDVYPSAREKKEMAQGVKMEEMARLARQKGSDAVFIGNTSDIRDYLLRTLRESDAVVVTLGAGDIWRVARELLK